MTLWLSSYCFWKCVWNLGCWFLWSFLLSYASQLHCFGGLIMQTNFHEEYTLTESYQSMLSRTSRWETHQLPPCWEASFCNLCTRGVISEVLPRLSRSMISNSSVSPISELSGPSSFSWIANTCHINVAASSFLPSECNIEARQLHASPAEATTDTDIDSFHQILNKSYTNYLLQLFCYVKLANWFMKHILRQHSWTCCLKKKAHPSSGQ